MTRMNNIVDASLKGTLAAAQSELAYVKERYAQALERERVLLEKLSAGDWISVKDRLPEENAEILYVVWNRREMPYAIRGMRCCDGTDWWWCNEDGDYDDTGNDPGVSTVTHWMPLPEPPAEVA